MKKLLNSSSIIFSNKSYLKMIISESVKNFFLGTLLFCFFSNLSAQSHISMQSHQNAVTAIASLETGNFADNSFFSAGEDGFLIKWTDDGVGEHYQISDLEIKMIARSPNGSDIAVYETDGGLINRVSVWNWKTHTRKFTSKRFANPVTSLSYTEKGTYIIVGTSAINGVVCLNSSTGTVVPNKLSNSQAIISMATSSATENSIVTYSPSGLLSYYNLRTGVLKAKFDIGAGFKQTVLFNNNVFFAGATNDGISVVQATTGMETSFVPAKNPILICGKFDKDLYYLEFDGKLYNLKVLENLDNNSVSSPKLVKKINRLPGRESIVCAAKSGNDIVLGSQNGNIYKINSDFISENRQISFYPLTDNMYDRISDISQTGESFYFLTGNAVYKSSYDNGIVDKVAANSNQTNILTYNDNIILWTKNSRKPIELIKLSDKTPQELFVPQKIIQTLRLFGDKLVILEGNTTVKVFNLKDNSITTLYEGSGLQDALLYDENSLYVAKSAATNPESPFIFVDTVTKEIVPISMSGNVAYSLNKSETENEIYGIRVTESSSGNSKTELFKFEPDTKMSSTILQINDEDPDSFVKLNSPYIYTNMGKDQIMSFNLQTKKQFHYKRSASLPLKIERNSSRLIILNRDGSISWYNPALATVLVDWYLTTEGQWYEF